MRRMMAVVAMLVVVGIPSVAARAQSVAVLSGTADVHFDDSMTPGTLPLPAIPKTWRFVGVSNGEKRNSNTLWFEDRDGTIYVIQTFTTGGTIIMNEGVSKLRRQP